MSINRFRAPTAISAAGVAAAGAVIVALSPVAHADDQWGACAAPANGAITRSAVCSPGMNGWGDGSPGMAENDALTICNRPDESSRRCTVVVTFTDCGAIAGNGSQWAGGRGPTQELAEQDALRNIANGKIARSICLLTE
jgi:uncharacterized protein DUF4189